MGDDFYDVVTVVCPNGHDARCMTRKSWNDMSERSRNQIMCHECPDVDQFSLGEDPEMWDIQIVRVPTQRARKTKDEEEKEEREARLAELLHSWRPQAVSYTHLSDMSEDYQDERRHEARQILSLLTQVRREQSDRRIEENRARQQGIYYPTQTPSGDPLPTPPPAPPNRTIKEGKD